MKKEVFNTYRERVASMAIGTVLEIGFGSGLNLPYYKNIDKLHALEPNVNLYKLSNCESVSQSFPIIHLSDMAEKISLADDSMDTVISTWTLCSINDPKQALVEIRRVLRPNGKFIFVEHGLSPNKTTKTAQHLLTPITKHLTGNCHLDRDITNLITQSGFTIEKIETFKEKGKPLMFSFCGIAKK